jgi:MFS family permease
VLGGFFVDYLSWRWVFLINLPVGIAAFVLCRRALAVLTVRRARRRIDYLGAALLTLAVADLLLVLTWGGTSYAWSSPEVLSLLALAPPLLAAFLLQELRAPEPVLPPRLFGNSVIRTANLASFIVAMAMFGGVVLLPVFLQLVIGVGAGHSGVLLIPLMAGSVVGAFGAGQAMRHTGRYKIFPLIGLTASAFSFALLATMTAATSPMTAMIYMGVLGLGLGSSMPVMLVAVQNATEPRDIGVATASVAFFRSLGGSFGAAVLWSIFLIALARGLAGAGGAVSLDLLQSGPDAAARLSPADHALLIPALVQAFRLVFAISAALTALGVAVTVFLRELPLRTTPARTVGEH